MTHGAYAAFVTSFRTGTGVRHVRPGTGIIIAVDVLLLEVKVDGNVESLQLAFPVEEANRLLHELTEALATLKPNHDSKGST